jgi:hypothetical protein
VDYSSHVDPSDPAVVALAARFSHVEEAYYFVRDRIRFSPMQMALSPGDIIADKSASCLGKCLLLVSLYRAMGVPAADVRVMVGELQFPEGTIDHAWVDMEYENGCLEQDASGLLGRFPFHQFPGGTYTAAFNGRGRYCFNDKGFAVVSQLNGMNRHRQAQPR